MKRNLQEMSLIGYYAKYRRVSEPPNQHMQLVTLPAYSPNMSPFEHVLDLVCRRLTRDPRPIASKDEL
ncbi:hypothetical protein TNCV_1227421 [Trichonephila clavipes]|nr:hypothetical protein TNCV_1227421 [Trichonephila clavipes]